MIRSLVTWIRKPNKSFSEQIVEIVFVVLPLAFMIRTFIFGLYKVPSGSMETTMLVGESFIADKLSVWFSPPKRGEIISFNQPTATYPYSKSPIKRLWQNYVWGPQNWTKRVVGVPGDHIQGKIEAGKPVVYINGEKLDEPYVNKYPLIGIWVREGKRGIARDFRSYDPEKSFQDQPFYAMNPDKVFRLWEGQLFLLEPQTPLQDGRDEFDVYLKDGSGPDGKKEYWVMGDNRLGSSDSRMWGTLDSKLIHGKIKFRLFSFDSNSSWVITDFLRNPLKFIKRTRWSRFFQFVH